MTAAPVQPRRSTAARIAALAVSLAASLAVSAIGGQITATSVGDWYQALAKPPLNPPDWIFAPVWITLYVLMAVAAWRVWDRGVAGAGRALRIYALQLALNLGWTCLFFGLRRPELALIEIAALLAAILWTIAAFRGQDRIAAWLLAPYAAWVAFATYLNAGIVALN